MEPILILGVCYGAVLLYLFNSAGALIQEEWASYKSGLIKKVGCICGVLVLLSAVNGIIFRFNGRFAEESELLYLNIFSSAVALSAAIGFIGRRLIFAGIIFLLYLFDLYQFHYFAASFTGGSLKDSGIGLSAFINLFINLIAFAVAMFMDHVITLEEPDNEYW